MKITLLALAGAAAAAPRHGTHNRLHHRPRDGYAGPSAGWALQNSTGPAATGVAAPDDSTTTLLETQYSTKTIVQTVYATRSKAGAGAEAPSAVAVEASADGACGPATVYVTATNKVTVTVSAGGAASSVYTPPSVPEASVVPEPSSVVAEAPSSVYEAPSISTAPVYVAPSSAAFVLESSSAVKEELPSSVAPAVSTAPAYSALPVSSAVVVSSAPVSSAVVVSSAAVSSAAPSATPSSSPGYSGGKRGLAYRWDGAADAKSFEGKNFGFAWNWEADSKGDIGSIPFIPTLRTLANSGDWAEKAEAAISSGSKVAFGLNEPDIASQANLGVSAACDAWKQYMNPIKEKHSDVTLVGPFVSSSANANQGLDWLSQFLSSCPEASVDAAGVHWYGTPADGFEAFKAHVEKAAETTGKSYWVTEFGLTGATDQQSADFLKEAQEYLDSSDKCQGYSYFAVGNFDPAYNLLGSASALTKTGEVYVS